MNMSQIYIAFSIVVLAIIAILIFFVARKGKEKRLTPLASLAFGFVLAGLFFGENPFVGFGLIGIGVILAVVDMYNKSKQK